jgi:hypothetical protein
MANISIEHKAKIGELIAEGHRRFGLVAPRRAYKREEEEKGGAGSAQNSPFEQHPLLAEMPTGAPSDLTYETIESSYAEEEGEKRSDEAVPELQHKLAESYTNRHAPRLSLY